MVEVLAEKRHPIFDKLDELLSGVGNALGPDEQWQGDFLENCYVARLVTSGSNDPRVEIRGLGVDEWTDVLVLATRGLLGRAVAVPCFKAIDLAEAQELAVKSIHDRLANRGETLCFVSHKAQKEQ